MKKRFGLETPRIRVIFGMRCARAATTTTSRSDRYPEASERIPRRKDQCEKKTKSKREKNKNKKKKVKSPSERDESRR